MEIQASRVRRDLLAKLNRHIEFERAATLTRNARERNLLLKRAKDCAQPFSAE
jgi:predicted RNA polymerase sigma factor